MSDPQDNYDVLAGCLRVNEAATVTSTLLNLPSELILRIASLLEIRDLLALRRIHGSIYSITQDKLLWRGLFRDLRLPQSRTLRSRHLDSLSYPELEEAVLHSCMVEHRWLKRREHVLPLPAMNEHPSIRFLDFLDDRWAVSVPVKGPPAIWDTRENPPKLLESPSHSFHDEIRGAVVTVDPHQGNIIIGLRQKRFTSQILRVHLAESRGDSLQVTNYGTISDPHSDYGVAALEPSRNAIIKGLLGVGIEVVDWTRSRSVVINMTRVNDIHVFEPILGLRLVGDYLLSFRSRRIELLYVPPFPDADEQLVYEHDPTSHPFHLRYKGVVFQGASLSEPQPNPESPDDSRIIYILAHETTVGFFYFRVTVYNPDYAPSEPRARMDVDLVGVYELDKPQVGAMGTNGRHLAFGSSLGPEGKRGIWIERPANKLKRFIVALSFDQSCPLVRVPVESGDDLRELCEIAPRIESKTDVFVIDSWDPSDDIVRCAFSESTGKIVLGTRNNRIMLLRC